MTRLFRLHCLKHFSHWHFVVFCLPFFLNSRTPSSSWVYVCVLGIGSTNLSVSAHNSIFIFLFARLLAVGTAFSQLVFRYFLCRFHLTDMQGALANNEKWRLLFLSSSSTPTILSSLLHTCAFAVFLYRNDMLLRFILHPFHIFIRLLNQLTVQYPLPRVLVVWSFFENCRKCGKAKTVPIGEGETNKQTK